MLSKENKFQLSTQADQISTQGIGLLLFSRTVRDCAHAINGWLYCCDDVGVEKNRTEKSIRYLIRYKPQEKWEIWLVCPLLGQNKILYRTLHFTGKAKEWLKLVARLSVKVAPCCKTCEFAFVWCHQYSRVQHKPSLRGTTLQASEIQSRFNLALNTL